MVQVILSWCDDTVPPPAPTDRRREGRPAAWPRHGGGAPADGAARCYCVVRHHEEIAAGGQLVGSESSLPLRRPARPIPSSPPGTGPRISADGSSQRDFVLLGSLLSLLVVRRSEQNSRTTDEVTSQREIIACTVRRVSPSAGLADGKAMTLRVI